MSLARKDDLDGAILWSQKALELNPTLEKAYLLLASSCAMKQASCEKEAYRRGLAAHPQSAELHNGRGLYALQSGHPAEAIKDLARANQLAGGNNPEFLSDLAYAHVFSGTLAEAYRFSRKAQALDPTCFLCVMVFGQILLADKKYEKAIDAYRRALKLSPKEGGARLKLAQAYYLNRQYKDALALYQALIAQTPRRAKLRVQAAQVLLGLHRPKEAIKQIKMALAEKPGRLRTLELLLKAQKMAGDRKGQKETTHQLRKLRK